MLLKKLIFLLVLFFLVVSIGPIYGDNLGFDKRAYTWTDKIFITIAAPDYNFDKYLIDEIGNDSTNPIKVSTRGHSLDHYKLVETGPSTGIFTGEVILTGFCHDADGDQSTGVKRSSKCNVGDDTNPSTEPLLNGGPTDGYIESDNDDGVHNIQVISKEIQDRKCACSSYPSGAVRDCDFLFAKSRLNSL